jgi:hypothetical protein
MPVKDWQKGEERLPWEPCQRARADRSFQIRTMKAASSNVLPGNRARALSNHSSRNNSHRTIDNNFTRHLSGLQHQHLSSNCTYQILPASIVSVAQRQMLPREPHVVLRLHLKLRSILRVAPWA